MRILVMPFIIWNRSHSWLLMHLTNTNWMLWRELMKLNTLGNYLRRWRVILKIRKFRPCLIRLHNRSIISRRRVQMSIRSCCSKILRIFGGRADDISKGCSCIILLILRWNRAFVLECFSLRRWRILFV